MSNHQIILSTDRALIFSLNPTIIVANTDVSLSIYAVGYGRAIATTGTRIWDASIFPAISVQNLIANTPFALPLITTNLPTPFFDAIINVFINGINTPLAISTSPDNISAYTQSEVPSQKILFWTDLYCFSAWNYGFGAWNFAGAQTTNNNYMFGGNSRRGEENIPLIVYFDDVLTIPITVTYTWSIYSYALGNIKNNTIVANLIPGQSQYTVGSFNFGAELLAQLGFTAHREFTGYLKITINIVDTNFRSLLPFYHWGLS